MKNFHSLQPSFIWCYIIIEWLGLDGTLKIIQFQTGNGDRQAQLPLDQVVQNTIQPGLECFNRWGIHNFSWVTCADASSLSQEKKFLIANMLQDGLLLITELPCLLKFLAGITHVIFWIWLQTKFDALSLCGNPVGSPTFVPNTVHDPDPSCARDTSKPIICKTVQWIFALWWLLIQF